VRFVTVLMLVVRDCTTGGHCCLCPLGPLLADGIVIFPAEYGRGREDERCKGADEECKTGGRDHTGLL
jgi:hypothetical protein